MSGINFKRARDRFSARCQTCYIKGCSCHPSHYEVQHKPIALHPLMVPIVFSMERFYNFIICLSDPLHLLSNVPPWRSLYG